MNTDKAIERELGMLYWYMLDIIFYFVFLMHNSVPGI